VRSPLLQVLALSGLLDDLLADFALCGVAEAGNGVSAGLVNRNQLLTVGALYVFLALLIELLLRYKLLLAAEDFCIFFSLDI